MLFFTHFLPIAKTPYNAAVINTAPLPQNVDTSGQSITGRKANLKQNNHVLTNNDCQ